MIRHFDELALLEAADRAGGLPDRDKRNSCHHHHGAGIR